MRRAAIAVVLAAGCVGAIGDPNSQTPEEPPGPPDPTARCEESKVGPPMLRRLTRDELEATIEDVFPSLGGAWEGVRLGPDPLSPLGFSNDGATLVVSSQVLREVGSTAEEVADLLIDDARLQQWLPCAIATPDVDCSAELIDVMGRRLFRRPITGEEHASYQAYFDSVLSRSTFETAVKWTVVALIQSPHTLYRKELGSSGELTRWEIATALSYTFGGTTPSEELLARAEAGELDDPAARIAEAQRLLDTPRGRIALQRFLREWSGYARVETQTRPNEPQFQAVRSSMVLETERFLDDVIAARGGGVRELLTADYTIVDDTLAQFYGFGAGVAGAVQRPPEWGVGLLAQGSILAGRAHAEASSPTLRGLFVHEKLLCRPRPPVPANVPPIPPEQPGAQTTRERYEDLHAGSDFCASCHRQFDPIGFSFEHFDELGRYRANEDGLTIDATGYILDLDDGSHLVDVDGQRDLATRLADLPIVTDCVSGLATYWAYGGGGGQTCLAEDARAALASGEVGLLEFVARLAAEPHFTRRAP